MRRTNSLTLRSEFGEEKEKRSFNWENNMSKINIIERKIKIQENSLTWGIKA